MVIKKLFLFLFILSCQSQVDVNIKESATSLEPSTPAAPATILKFSSSDTMISTLEPNQSYSVTNSNNTLIYDTTSTSQHDYQAIELLDDRRAIFGFTGTADTLIGDGNAVSGFDGLSLGTANDSDGTLTFRQSKVGIGIELDGVNDYLLFPSNSNLEVGGDAITVMAWFRNFKDQTGLISGDTPILCKGTTGNQEHYMLSLEQTRSLNFRTTTDNGHSRLSTGRVAIGEWTHLAGIYDGASMKLYANGKLVGEIAQTGNLLTDSSNLHIGRRCNTDTRYFGGDIDEIGIWDVAFTEEQLLKAYKSQLINSQFTSKVLNAVNPVAWSQMSWELDFPWGKELPNNKQVETGFDDGNIDMSGNLLLLHMNEDPASTSILDTSGDGNLPSCTTCPVFESNGLFQSSLSFNGSNQYLEVPHSANFLAADSGSISFWVWPKGTTGSLPSYQGLFSKDASGFTNGGHLNIGIDDGLHIIATLSDTTTDYIVEAADDTLIYNKWQHVVLTYGPSGMKLYLDGVQVDNDPYTGGLGTSSGGSGNTEPIAIGANAVGSTDGAVTPLTDYFNGELDELAFFDKELPAADVLNLYKRGTNKVSAYIKSCSSPDCSGTPSFISTKLHSETSSLTGTETYDISSLVSDSQYFQFKVEIENLDENYSPIITNIEIENSGE